MVFRLLRRSLTATQLGGLLGRGILAALLTLGFIAAATAQGCGSGNPNCVAPTAPTADATNKIATTAFVHNVVSAGGVVPLTNAHIFVGNGSNVATDVALSGDCTMANTGAITCTKTGGVAFGAFATGTNAANLTGTVASARLTGAYTGITGTATLTTGATGAGFTIQLGASTVTGNLPIANQSVIAANNLIGNQTSGTITATAIPMPSCSGATNVLTYVSGSGFGCNTISGSYTGITGVGTLTTGATGAGFTIQLGASTVTGNLPIANQSVIAANNLIGNQTSGTITATAIPMPSCSGATNALKWTTNTGFGCNTISAGGGIVGAIYVSNYAVCDGVTNDTAAIQAAMNATPANGLLIFPTKVCYVASGVTMPTNFAVEGNNAILYTDQNINIWNISTAAFAFSNVNIRNLWFQASSAPGGYGTTYIPRAILVLGANPISNSSFENIVTIGMWNGIGSSAPASGIYITGGLALSAGAHATDQFIRFTNGLGTGTIIANNRIGMGVGGIGTYITGAAGDIIIANNQYEGSGSGDVCLFLQPTAYGERFQVTGNKMDTCATPIRTINVSGSSFIGNGFAGGTFMDVQGNAIGNNYANNPDTSFAFAGVMTGMTTAPIQSVRWTKTNASVTLKFTGQTATSNAGTFTMTGLPAEIWPSNNQVLPMILLDNGGGVAGIASVETSGAIIFYSSIGAGGWTGSGSKGIPYNTTITYMARD